jgi:hypothetical protein
VNSFLKTLQLVLENPDSLLPGRDTTQILSFSCLHLLFIIENPDFLHILALQPSQQQGPPACEETTSPPMLFFQYWWKVLERTMG